MVNVRMTLIVPGVNYAVYQTVSVIPRDFLIPNVRNMVVGPKGVLLPRVNQLHGKQNQLDMKHVPIDFAAVDAYPKPNTGAPPGTGGRPATGHRDAPNVPPPEPVPPAQRLNQGAVSQQGPRQMTQQVNMNGPAVVVITSRN